jgi:hypothetical protein
MPASGHGDGLFGRIADGAGLKPEGFRRGSDGLVHCSVVLASKIEDANSAVFTFAPLNAHSVLVVNVIHAAFIDTQNISRGPVGLQRVFEIRELHRGDPPDGALSLPVAIVAAPMANLDEQMAVACDDQLRILATTTERRCLRLEGNPLDAGREPSLWHWRSRASAQHRSEKNDRKSDPTIHSLTLPSNGELRQRTETGDWRAAQNLTLAQGADRLTVLGQHPPSRRGSRLGGQFGRSMT